MRDNMQKLRNNDTFTDYDPNYNYEDDNAEAVIYFITPKGKTSKPNLFVMKRYEAIKFCSRKETKGTRWALCFSTHKRNWKNELKNFRKDDGRFNELLEELGIEPIYRKLD